MEFTHLVLRKMSSMGLMFLISEPSIDAELQLQGFSPPPSSGSPQMLSSTRTFKLPLINHKYTLTKGEVIFFLFFLLFISSWFSGSDRLVSVGGGQWEWEAEGSSGASRPRHSGDLALKGTIPAEGAPPGTSRGVLFRSRESATSILMKYINAYIPHAPTPPPFSFSFSSPHGHMRGGRAEKRI